MTELNMEKITKRYNGIMMDICAEHKTIGTDYAENTENWNLRDMIAECDYWLSCYYEEGNSRHDMISEDPNTWKSETGKLKRFIARFKDEAMKQTCTEGHCSKYDNDGNKALTEAIEELKQTTTMNKPYGIERNNNTIYYLLRDSDRAEATEIMQSMEKEEGYKYEVTIHNGNFAIKATENTTNKVTGVTDEDNELLKDYLTTMLGYADKKDFQSLDIMDTIAKALRRKLKELKQITPTN